MIEPKVVTGSTTEISRLVFAHRVARGLKVVELAEASGLSHSTISKVENGVRAPSLETLEALAKGLQLTWPDAARLYEIGGYTSRVVRGSRARRLEHALWSLERVVSEAQKAIEVIKTEIGND